MTNLRLDYGDKGRSAALLQIYYFVIKKNTTP